MIGRLSTAGIQFTQQPSVALIAAALDLAALLSCDLSTAFHLRAQQHAELAAQFEQHNPQTQQQQQEWGRDARVPNPSLRVPAPALEYSRVQWPLLGRPQSCVLLEGAGNEVIPEFPVLMEPEPACVLRLHSLLAPVLCFFSCQLQQHLQAELLQRQDLAQMPDGVVPAARHTAPGSTVPESSSSIGASTGSRSDWATAEGLLLCAVDRLQSCDDHYQQQQELELCKRSQRYSQQAWQQLGFSPELMQEVAAWLSSAGQYSRDTAAPQSPSSTSGVATSSSSSSSSANTPSSTSPLSSPCGLYSASECLKFAVAAGIVLHGSSHLLSAQAVALASEPGHSLQGELLHAVQADFSLITRLPQLVLGALNAGMQLVPADTLPLVPAALFHMQDVLDWLPSVGHLVQKAEAAATAAAAVQESQRDFLQQYQVLQQQQEHVQQQLSQQLQLLVQLKTQQQLQPQQQQEIIGKRHMLLEQQRHINQQLQQLAQQQQQQQTPRVAANGMAVQVAPFVLLTSQLTNLLQQLLRQPANQDAAAAPAGADTGAAAAAGVLQGLCCTLWVLV